MADMPPEQAAQFSRAGNAIFVKLQSHPVPSIAVVSGYALGGGCELALSCDIRLASENAVFGLPEVSLGILPGYGGLQRLVRLIGPSRTKMLALSATRIKAWQAQEWGLVEEVHPPESLLDAALELAGKIAANAPVGVRAAKQVVNQSVGLTLEQSESLESDLFGSCFGTNDQRMAMKAFVEKKKPEPFTGS